MYTYEQPSMFSGKRGLIFLAVVLFHLLLGYALKSGLGGKYLQSIINPVEVAQIDEDKADDKPPPPPPKMEDIRPYVPPPEFVTTEAAITETTAIAAVTAVKAAAPPRVIPRTPAVPDARTLKFGEDYYPDQSKRLGEEGTCRVEMQIGADGRVASSAIKQSSGFPRLDEACLRAVKGARFKPATEEGKPVAATVILPIKWQLRQ
jgi:periplasmic protein TonB